MLASPGEEEDLHQSVGEGEGHHPYPVEEGEGVELPQEVGVGVVEAHSVVLVVP